MLRAISLFSILVIAVAANAADEVSLPLEGGLTLKLNAIPTARNVPYVYVDQALETLSSTGANAGILTHRRLGSLGGNSAASYSLIAYSMANRPNEVSVEGQVLINGRAWAYNVGVPREHWEQSLLVVVEALSALPSNHSLQARRP